MSTKLEARTVGLEHLVGPTRLCRDDNWDNCIDNPAPRAIRWATRDVGYEKDWCRWHYTEGNGSFTACGWAVQIFTHDGSPQEHDLEVVDCATCLKKMKPNATLKPPALPGAEVESGN